MTLSARMEGFDEDRLRRSEHGPYGACPVDPDSRAGNGGNAPQRAPRPPILGPGLVLAGGCHRVHVALNDRARPILDSVPGMSDHFAPNRRKPGLGGAAEAL